jgi:DNA-binding transcriptional LysR family regulator
MSVHLKIRDLQLVVALYEEANLTQAAQQVGITEPAFSKRLRLIERRMKTQLFERSHEGTVITESGRAFVEHARQCVIAFQRGVHEAHETRRGVSHKLRIGASSFLPQNLIELLRSIELRLYRDLSIEIVFEYSCELLSQLQHHQLDLALVTSPPPNAAITSFCVATSPFMLVFREDHPLAGRESATLAEVAEYPWVVFSRNVHPPLYELIRQRLDDEHRKATVVHQISQAEQVPALLTDNRLLAWVTPACAERIARQGYARIPLRDSHICLETHLATLTSNNSRLVSEYVRSFVKRIEEQRPAVQLSLPIG